MKSILFGYIDMSPFIAVPLFTFSYLLIGFVVACYFSGTSCEDKFRDFCFKESVTITIFGWPISLSLSIICLIMIIIYGIWDGFIRIKKFYVKELANFFTKLSEK